MDAKTDEEAISDALEDLGDTQLEKFCRALRKRREEPKISKYAIENKSRQEIAEILVQTFNEDYAVKVTLTILKRINCNKVAQDLEKHSKAVVASASDLNTVPENTIRRNDLNPKPESDPRRSVTFELSVYNNPKAKLKSTLKSLQDNRNTCKEFEQTYKDVVQYNKKQVVTSEKLIRAEIEKLHQFLREEEEKRVSALKEEDKQKAEIVTREMKNIQEQFSSLSDQISDIEQELQKPNVSFIRDKYTLSEPQLVSGVLIDVAKHLGNLAYRVCEEIKEKVPFSPVILDPNTANGYLCLSEDLTSVGGTDETQQLPDNPERFTEYPSVLGSEGFSSGTHTWEVEVGNHKNWNIGYVKESVDRKKERDSATPGDGLWCLRRHRRREYSDGVHYFQLKKDPTRIRIQLDYDKGKVSFYDTKRMTHIYTHEGPLTEKLYPYLNYKKQVDAKTTDIRICQLPQRIQTPIPFSKTHRNNKKSACVLQ